MRRGGALRAFLRHGMLGAGMDNHGLPGSPRRKVIKYTVSCMGKKNHSYTSVNYDRRCKKCGAEVSVTRKG
jgi:hypothetical protein